MKRIVKNLLAFVTIIIMIIIVLFALNIKTNATNDSLSFSALNPINTDWGLKYNFCANNLTWFNNLYCIEHGSYVGDGEYKWQLRYEITINGTRAHIINLSTKEERETDLLSNNIMAAILCEAEGKDNILGYGSTSDGYQNQSQLALWMYWKTWKSENGLNELNDGKDVPADGVESYWLKIRFGVEDPKKDYLDLLVPKYETYAKQKNYNAKLYIFLGEGSRQNLMLVERGDITPTNQTIDIPVEKQWNDGENKYNTRKEINVELLANDESTKKIITLNENNGWKGTFEKLDEKDSAGNIIDYTVREVDTPEGYTPSIVGSKEKGFKITNTLLTEVKVVKQWDDLNNIDAIRPSSLKVALYSNELFTGTTVTLDENNNWTATFKKLNKYDKNGKEISYTVQEEAISGYTQTKINKNEDNKGHITWTITNKHTTLTQVKVVKQWDDQNNSDAIRPSSLKVTLYSNGATVKTVTLNENNNWTATFEELIKYDSNGNKIIYTVQEEAIPGYTETGKTKTEDNEGHITWTITNKHTTLTQVKVVKQWDDQNNSDAIRPSSLKVTLYSNGATVKTVTLNENNNWTATFEELTKYDTNGNKIIYTVQEEAIPGYTQTGKNKVEDSKGNITWTITNKHTPLTQVKVVKQWDDQNNSDGIRPSSLKVTLYSNGVPTVETVTLNENNNWTATFEELIKYDNKGNKITYTVQEEAVPEYVQTETNKSEDDKGYITWTIKNEHIPTTKVKVVKQWDDLNNVDKIRPSSLQVILYSNGSPTEKTVILNESNNWTAMFERLRKYDIYGNEIIYTVQEEAIPEYTQTGKNKTEDNEGYIIWTITNKHIPLTQVKAVKQWDDENDIDEIRPSSLKVTLYSNGSFTEKTATLNENNNWTATFEELTKYDTNGNKIIYTVQEEAIPGYTQTGKNKVEDSKGNITWTITNKHIPYIEISVEKEWNDGKNKYNTRKEIKVELLANNAGTGNIITLNEANGWKETFQDLEKQDSDGNIINYAIREINTPEGYTSSITGNKEAGFKITNTLLTQVKVVKEWNDQNNIDEVRPSSLKITLYSNGVSTGKTVILNENNNWTATFDGLEKYDIKRNEIIYTVQEETISGYTQTESNKAEDNKGYITLTITNKHIPNYDGYIEISGKVWIDKPDGKGNNIDGVYVEPNTEKDSKDILKEGVTVRLKYINNGHSQLFDSKHPSAYETKTNSNGEYTIKVNYDNSQNVYKLYEDLATVNKKLETAYVEFEYDGMQYTTVASATTGANTSKATENETTRNTFDSNHATVISGTTHPDKWTDKNITAVTGKVVSYDGQTTQTEQVTIKYCNGDGTYIRTNPEGAWKDILLGTGSLACNNGQGHELDKYEVQVKKIPNINLGLFEREQPDVAIFSDLTKVEVEMNNQKYTYLYGVRGAEGNNVGLQAKFQNKGTYTYRRPVNPADIAYLQEEAHSNAMSVVVTYEVKIANLSTTLPITVHNIKNYYDTRYRLNTEGWTVSEGSGFKQATSGELNMTVNPQTESSAIELIYTVSIEAIRNLLNEEATLNNAVEIESFSTAYGAKTLYAEQRTNGRTGQAYAGYDYNSHPGNAGIFINGDGRLEAAKLEDDTDLAPSFVLVAENQKTLAGTVWEDVDEIKDDDERLGDGYKGSDEVTAQNVKVELYNLDGTPAKLYQNGATKDAVTYTDKNGYYQLEGVVTGEYYLKFTYGDDTTELQQGATTMDEGKTTVNARNYKSTIIANEIVKNIMSKDYTSFSEEEKKWHITHTPGYSVAVDNMLDRLDIPDLQYNNFRDGYIEPQNMTAYTKPFKTQIEFESSGQSNVDISGNISGVTNVLNSLDFGISERPRENLYAQKTISYIKIRLANGQLLTEGDPRTQDLSYVKAMGFGQKIDSGAAARAAIEKQLLVEIDTELIQGAQLEINYEVTVTNDNELDYDYGTKEDYPDIIGNNYITKSSKAKYYYYGDDEGLGKNDEIKATIEFVDYLNSNIVYNADTNTDWKSKDISDLKDENGNKLVSVEVKDFIIKNDYRVLVSNAAGSIDGKVTLARGSSLDRPLKMSVNKILTNQAENVYDNGIEIIKIDGKTARTIQESQNGKQIEKEYKPGNYIPKALSSELEQDDDRVKVIITPPTGIINYITTYTITGLIGLLIIILGIVFIKKKVLTK